MLYQLGICGRKKGFTLVELLVVIAIIALLLSILMPALGKVRVQATRLVCTTRLKDVGMAMGLYANDYKGAVPPTQWTSKEEQAAYQSPPEGVAAVDWSWCARLAGYYGKDRTALNTAEAIWQFKLYRCPTQDYIVKLVKKARSNMQPVRLPLGAYLVPGQGDGAGVFGLNPYFSGYGAMTADQTYNFRYLSAVKKTLATLPILGDIAAESAPVNGKPVMSLGGIQWEVIFPHSSAYKYGWPNKVFNSGIGGPAPNHAGYINYLFGDFHAESKAKVWPWSNHSNPLVSRDAFFHPTKYPDSQLMP
jgi:prepilin-type N-terminal cleavage/methylation domain-containing protein/prepilin-type processing-associated H-X9-DG protein